MCEINPDISSKSNYIDDITVKKFDAVIATALTITKYFEYYFKNVPQIIRKNRRSISDFRW